MSTQEHRDETNKSIKTNHCCCSRAQTERYKILQKISILFSWFVVGQRRMAIACPNHKNGKQFDTHVCTCMCVCVTFINFSQQSRRESLVKNVIADIAKDVLPHSCSYIKTCSKTQHKLAYYHKAKQAKSLHSKLGYQKKGGCENKPNGALYRTRAMH